VVLLKLDNCSGGYSPAACKFLPKASLHAAAMLYTSQSIYPTCC